MCAGLDRAQTNTNSMHGIFFFCKKKRTVHHERQDLENQETKMLQIMAVISAVLLECVLAPEKARWASVVTTKHDVNSTMRGSGNHTPSSKGFAIHNASTTICINSPPMIIMAKFFCNGTIIGKKPKSRFPSLASTCLSLK